MCKRRLWKLAPLYKQKASWKKGGSLTLNSERKNKILFWKRNISRNGSSARGTLREGSFAGDPEGHINECSGNRRITAWGSCSQTGEVSEPYGALSERWAVLLPGNLLFWDIRYYIKQSVGKSNTSYRGTLVNPGERFVKLGFWETVKGDSVNRSSVYIGDLRLELEGTGFLLDLWCLDVINTHREARKLIAGLILTVKSRPDTIWNEMWVSIRQSSCRLWNWRS